jgi:hypothetical protein
LRLCCPFKWNPKNEHYRHLSMADWRKIAQLLSASTPVGLIGEY